MSEQEQVKENYYPSLLAMNRKIRFSGIKPLTLVGGILAVALSFLISRSFIVPLVLAFLFFIYIKVMSVKARDNDF